MEAANIIKFEQGDLIENQVSKIVDFLTLVGLPSDNIIANTSEREIIGKNLPQYIYDLPADIKRDARYLSKFVVGAGFGLFDYALNSIWNEVVLALRNKAIAYGLEIFFDKAVGGKLREAFEKEEDLAGLKDQVLLNSCKALELISETTYKKLAHILDMRNDIGISHPTNYTINAFELLGWLQTCIQDVLKDKPSESAIQVKAFIDNLKSYGVQIEDGKLEIIKPEIKSLATHHCDNILRTIFGLYVARDTKAIVRKNISLISAFVWIYASDEEKHKIGIILAGYNNNLSQEKHARGEEFFNTVKGNNFRTTSERIIALSGLINKLREAHYAYDNYYHEAPIAEEIMTYIGKASNVPTEVANLLVRTILLCRIGRGYSFQQGVSPKAKPFYDMFFRILDENLIPQLIIELTKPEIQQKLSWKIVKQQAIEMLTITKENLINERMIEAINYLIENFPKSESAIFSKDFKNISSAFINYN